MADVPPRPERPVPPRDPARPARGNWLVVLVAFGSVLAALLSLMLLPLLSFAPVIVILLFGFTAFHYVIWGQWLSRYIRQHPTDEDDEA